VKWCLTCLDGYQQNLRQCGSIKALICFSAGYTRAVPEAATRDPIIEEPILSTPVVFDTAGDADSRIVMLGLTWRTAKLLVPPLCLCSARLKSLTTCARSYEPFQGRWNREI